MSNEKVLHIGVASREWIKRRTIAIAKGERKPLDNEPRVWFSSIELLGKVLSERNMLLIEIIRNSQPCSLAELAEISGQGKARISRTVRDMERYGFLEMSDGGQGKKMPRLKFDRVNVEFELSAM